MSQEFHPNSTDAVLARTITTLERVEKRLDEGDTRFNEQEKRIQKLEGWRYYIVGISVGIGLALRAGWEWLTNHPKH